MLSIKIILNFPSYATIKPVKNPNIPYIAHERYVIYIVKTAPDTLLLLSATFSAYATMTIRAKKDIHVE